MHRPAARRAAKGTLDATLEQVVHELELEVVLGRMRPRERLIEDDLMARFGAKRHVVRSALSELEKRGLIERRQNKGARVREYSRDEVKALYEFRSELHRLAVTKMPLPIPAAVVRRLETLASAHEEAVAEGQLAKVIALNNEFHDCLFDQCGNTFLAATIRQMAAATIAIRSYRIGDPALLTQAAREHREMIEAARFGRGEKLLELCTRHILPSRDLYLRDHAAAK